MNTIHTLFPQTCETVNTTRTHFPYHPILWDSVTLANHSNPPGNLTRGVEEYSADTTSDPWRRSLQPSLRQTQTRDVLLLLLL